MKFKPAKSRCMIIKKGQVSRKFHLKVQGEEIPPITDGPIRCLGKWYDETLSDKNNVESTQKRVEEWLRRIESSGLPGKYKVWIYQHGMLPRLMWLLMLYEIPLTKVEKIEKAVSKSLRKWLGVPPGFSAIGLYSKSSQLQMPLSSVVEEFKVEKCRLVMTLRDSKDRKVSKAGVQVRTGRKWVAISSVSQAESMLELRDIMGNTCIGRQGLGMQHFQQWKKADGKEKRDMILKEIRREEEDRRRSKSVQLVQQGAWMRWDLPARKITWSELWRLDPFRISFMLRSVYDTLPSPSNLCKWGLAEDPTCKLCGGPGSLAHILSGCKIALQQGRYRWRHDRVLQTLADVLETERRNKRPEQRQESRSAIHFVKAGEKGKSRVPIHRGLLREASPWEMRVDLHRKLVFPEVVLTNLRPDMVLWSEAGKKIILIELTVPWEEGCEEAHERKLSKYQELLESCRAKKWSAWLFPVEVGARGFPAQSAWRLLQRLGMSGRAKRAAVRRMGEAAERASSWIWFKRDEPNWGPSNGE